MICLRLFINCAVGYLLHYVYFNEQYRLIAIDISKQLAPDPNRKAIQQINVINGLQGNTDASGNLFSEADMYLSKRFVKLMYK